ncbi:Do family serine endopeptidase [Altererythrobacter buctensis]|uniref:Probable periplasmic serine endoprotease DegP-like n=1 Tax=Alteraurantiacibacter buctensis TaxID=1503981 RepID=A0A844YP65_9SPHN|nr:Do family serine endopeptidase [Alteraurantiacibacter buctensis]
MTLMTGYPAGAQVAQNENLRISNAAPVPGAPASFADLTEALMPAVVNISTRQQVTVAQQNPFAGTPFADMFGNRGGGGAQTRQAQSLGSGFLISADGYVVTNNHVINPPDSNARLESVTVTLADGTEYEATVVGQDEQSDIAVLKINRAQPFPFVRFGDSSNARVGDWVIAIGNPFGLDGTVTSGIISAVHRSTGSRSAFDRYLQTDASINQGNSGGPLFDMAGNVIGINNAILSPSGGNVGIGLAIPAEDAAPVVQALMRGETIARGYLGVQIQPIDEDFAEALGIPRNSGEFIQGVQPGEAAEAAGLQAGDVVTSVNNLAVTRDRSLSYIVANIEPGTRVPVEYIRDGQTRRTTVTVGRRPSNEELRNQQQFGQDGSQEDDPLKPGASSGLAEQALGVQVIAITPQIARQLGGNADMTGVVITAVDPSADAATKGLARGVVISSANGQPVSTPQELEAQIRAVQQAGRGAIVLRVRQRGQPEVSMPVRLRPAN